ncbi:hypothetical protein LTR48_006044 [Friedmanniomyces endolithicus]|uniref:C2H2-type domain-containing protein n=1 Tax=Rachicladosporium monterosium TaxID=1507873 RepID=A0ABR0L0C8_9PEZI|nr:hypothetical protein LTR29_015083 [Friedmanniomyces endolithicus]KAK1083737.1 hypothetical protein LTR48_006044 [Friedmanniomyces endolithicus]KAK5141532.1 hypothetical protein LTR32_005926 [Rachicladosporium monterosium]
MAGQRDVEQEATELTTSMATINLQVEGTEAITSTAATNSQIKARAQNDSPVPKIFTISLELRNSIYELVFACPDRTIYMLSAASPCRCLLYTCRQMYQEAEGIHKSAHQHFYSTSHFVLYCLPKPLDQPVRFSREDLRHIQHLTYIFAIWEDGSVRPMPTLDGSPAHRPESIVGYRRRANGLWSFDSIGDMDVTCATPLIVRKPPAGALVNGCRVPPLVFQESAVGDARRPITAEEMNILLDFPLEFRADRPLGPRGA